MPKVWGTVTVTAIPGEDWRFHVESYSDPKHPHLVDIAAHYPLGKCSCHDWSCRRFPEWKKTLKPVRCRHLAVAREAALNGLIRLTAHPGNPEGE